MNITEAIKLMWNNKKDKEFIDKIQNHQLISMAQNIKGSSCKLHLHIDEYNGYMKKMIEQITRDPKRRIQILPIHLKHIIKKSHI